MNRPRIFVFHIKQIIKASAFIIIGLLVLVSLVYFFFQRDDGSVPVARYDNYQLFLPGTYRAKVTLSYRPVYVEVTVTEDEITRILLEPLSENQEVFYPLLSPTMDNIAQEIIYSQSLNVTSTYENATTSRVLVNAISRALYEARNGAVEL